MAVVEKPKTFAEKLFETHHPLPWFPNKQEAEVYGCNRIRMGCPDEGENLRWRYREVTGGDTPASWTDDDFLFGFNFEWALADLMACAVCEAHGHAGCTSVKGGGYFMDLHHTRTAESGKPCFVMTLCKDPFTRKAQIARRQVTYRA